MPDPRRYTPATDTVLAAPELREARHRLGHALVRETVRGVLQRCRAGDVDPDDVVAAVQAALPATASSLRPVINATGIVVHTNLGRAPLSAAAIDAITAAAGTTDVELDLATGRRGRRGRGALAALAAAVPEAGGVHVVNNGAAALALVALGLAAGRSIVVARGELVEIGDGFRLPELLESVGARLREVGTTNRVNFEDYAAAIDDDVAFVLKVHPSNFQITGFTSSVPVDTLARLPVPTVVDIGSGLLHPHPRLPAEPAAATTLRAGASLVTASGDKLLGGPQCGLLLGDRELIEMLRRHPFARALRIDKLTLAALEASITGPPPPVVQALERQPAQLRARAEAAAAALDGILPVEVVETSGAVGGGGAPGVSLPSAAIAVPAPLAPRLRLGEVAVIGRAHRGRLLLDLLAVEPADDQRIVAAIRTAATGDQGR